MKTLEWKQLYDNGLDKEYALLMLQAKKRAEQLGLHQWLWPFQFQDVCRASLKQNVLIAFQMGLGKTRVSIALAKLYGSERTLIIAPKRLWGEWVSEVSELGLLGEFQIVETLNDARNLKRLNLASLTDLWRIPKDSPHRERKGQANYRVSVRGDAEVKVMGFRYSLGWYLRKRCGTVIVDEAYSLKDIETNQTRAITNIKAKHKVLLTGTPVRGYPNNILSLLNWALGNGSDVWPEYSFFVQGAVQRFLEKFGTYIYFDEQHSRTASKGKKKLLPKIKDPAAFQAMLAPFMIRRLNTEPEVQECIQIPAPQLHYETIEMDLHHRAIYEKVLANFRAWYEEVEEEAARNFKSVNQRELLNKLTALISCAAFPQKKGEQWVSAKQQKVIDLVRGYVAEGRKVIVLSRSVDGARWIRDKLSGEFQSVYIDGSVSLTWDRKTWSSKRMKLLSYFRKSDVPLLIGTTPCLAEGLNLPEASVVIFMDYDWVPSVMAQAFSRVLRPQQKRDVHVHFLTCKGTIEEYMQLLCNCKQNSIAEGLDYEDYDFQVEDLPDIRAYAQALIENNDILSRLSRKRRLMDEEPENELVEVS